MVEEILYVLTDGGLSSREIARRLRHAYGIEASDVEVVQHLELMRYAGIVVSYPIGWGLVSWDRPENAPNWSKVNG